MTATGRSPKPSRNAASMTYRELLERQDAPAGSSWGLFGPADDSGMINFIERDQVLRGAACVRRGVRFNLDYPVNAFSSPPLIRRRHRAIHQMFSKHLNQFDDRVDGLWLQGTSQIDGLRHRRHETHGFYNGIAEAEVAIGSPTLGVNRWAEAVFVSRGVLIDVDSWLRQNDRPLNHAEGEAITTEMLDGALADQGIEIEAGDIALVRTGWCHYYLDILDEQGRSEVTERLRSPGLEQSREMLAWLWDKHIPLVAADNIGVEALPPVPSSPFRSELDGGLMHPEAIALMGLALGELWALDALAADCAADGQFACMVVAKPLHLIGGVGSPANAVAIK